MKRPFEIIDSKEHLTIKGFKKLVAIKASMNKGLPDDLKTTFPDITPVLRPKAEAILIRDPN
jgi:hypothetical protein